MARGHKKPFSIRGGAARAYGTPGQDSFMAGRKESGVKVHKGHGRSKRQRKVATGRM